MLSRLSLDSARDRALMMRAMPTFAGLDDDSLGLIAAHARTRVLRPGSALAATEGAFFAVRGRLGLARNGTEIPLPDLASPIIGLLPMLSSDPSGFGVGAAEETVVLELPRQVVLDVLEEHFVIVRQLLRQIAGALLYRLRKEGPLAELAGAMPNEPYPPAPIPGKRSRVDEVLRLREMPMFAHADLDALFAIIDHSRTAVLEPGDILWRAGDRVSSVVALEEGSLVATPASGAPVVLSPPNGFGDLEAIAFEPVTYTLAAETRARVQRLEIQGVLMVVESHFQLARNMLMGASDGMLSTSAEATLPSRPA